MSAPNELALMLMPNQARAMMEAQLPMFASVSLETPDGLDLAARCYAAADSKVQNTPDREVLNVTGWPVQLNEDVDDNGEVKQFARLTMELDTGKRVTTGSPHFIRTFGMIAKR